MFDDDSFAHYGIKGMRWGVRRDQPAGKAKTSKEASEMSDADLQARVQRLNLEKQYVSLVAAKAERERNPLVRGEDAVKNVVSKNAANAVNAVASQLMYAAVNTAVNVAIKKASGR